MSACTYQGRKGEPRELRQGRFPCFRKASVTIRENMARGGNPFRERAVCRVHADEMIEDGYYIESPTSVLAVPSPHDRNT